MKTREKSDVGIVLQGARKSGRTQLVMKAGDGEGRPARLMKDRTVKESADMTDNLRNRSNGQAVQGELWPEEVKASKSTEVQNERRSAVTIEEIAEESNLKAAYEEVKENNGAPGVDRQSVQEVGRNLAKILRELRHQLLEGSYNPGEIRRVWIPKSNGGKRGLGIPNVVDRIVQQAINRKMMPVYEPIFSASSHGFRPERSCHTAIKEAMSYVAEGRKYVVDLDLERFFDTVHHERLMSKLKQKITDGKVLKIIHRMLKARIVMPDGVKVANDEGVPQGGPLSPLLSNIVLHELDEELTRRGHKFVRYADDCNIYVHSMKAGQRVMESVSKFIERRLRLKVNKEKSKVAEPKERHFLGFSLTKNEQTESVEIALSDRTKKRICAKIVELTPRNWGGRLEECILAINRYLQGWIGFFGICSESELRLMQRWDAHIRRRLRAIKLKQWKRKRTIAKKLIELGTRTKKVWQIIYAGRKSFWALSHTSVVESRLRNAYFAELGLYTLQNLWTAYQLKHETVAMEICN